MIITDHPKSYLERLFTDYRPMAEIVFAKKRGQDRQENIELNIEEFISIKGIGAMGNQLTKYKVNEINALSSLPFESPAVTPKEELEVVDEEEVVGFENPSIMRPVADLPPKQKPITEGTKDDEEEPPIDEDGQATLF
jgi:topoisomerase-4 subunit A